MYKQYRSLRQSLIGVFLLCLVSITSAELLDTQVSINVERFKLDNGLTVLVHSDHSTPTVFVGMWYGVGSKDEPAGKTGFAHLFEHLMFQGTENRDGEYFSPFTEAGATGMNGTTNADRTNYYATVPSGALDMALWMESDRMSHLLGAVTQEALDEQRSVVQNEKRQRESRPYAKMGEKIRDGLYPQGHPYRHATIGSMEDLDAATLDDVHEWFNTYYGASNVVLVLAGDVTLEVAREKVAHYFAAAPVGKPLTRSLQWIPSLPENRIEHMFDDVGNTRIARVWSLPNLNQKDSTLMYLVNDAFVANKNSPLRRKLVDELRLATRVSGGAYSRVLSGEYSLTIDLKPGVDPAHVLQIVDDTLAEFLADGPDGQIVENAKLGVNMYILGALETGASIGRMLAEGELYSDDPLFVNKELEWLNAANPEQLRKVAEKWLSRNYYQLTVEPFPDLNAKAETVDRSEIPSVSASTTINFPPIQTATLENGIKLVVATRGQVPLVDVSVQLQTGTMAEDVGHPGTAAFVFGLMDKGTRRMDANELAAAKDKIGMSGTPGAGAETSQFAYRILTNNLDESLQLTAEILRNPTFPKEELDKQKDRIAAYLANLEHVPSNAARSLFDRALFGDQHPFGAVWSRELLAGVGTDALRAFHEREVAPDNMTIYMIGDISIETAKAAVQQAFGKWRAQGRSAQRDVGEALASAARVILVDYPGAESSTIVAGHAIDAYDPTIYTELTVMNRAFGGGFESRLNMNLREDKGWSYGYRSGIRTNNSGDMTFATSGQVQTDKTADAMREIRLEFDDFIGDRPATDSEVDRIKLNRSRSLPGLFATNGGFLSSMISSANYGLPFDYAASAADRIAAITTDAIRERAEKTLQPDVLTWVVVADLAKVEADIRALQFGDVEVWDPYGNRVR